jgi:glycosyltransferase involved in cell wall biosynthesis
MLQTNQANLQMAVVPESEAEITAQWTNKNDIVVSILCTAFNHQKYIHDALNGFLIQQTSFAFEVIIHDDASTDDTASIIKEYQQRFPSIIKPIYQEKNTYTQNLDSMVEWMVPKAQGKYFALCEGDDFWIDPSKLQKQYDALEEKKTCDVCFHPVITLFSDGSTSLKNFHRKDSWLVPIELVITGGGGFMPTASLFMRREAMQQYADFILHYGFFTVTDTLLQFVGAQRGGALFLPSADAVYRVMSVGSYSAKIKKNALFLKQMSLEIIRLNESIDDYSNSKYHLLFEQKLHQIIKKLVTNPLLAKTDRNHFFQTYRKYLPQKRWLTIQIITFLKKVKLQGTNLLRSNT